MAATNDDRLTLEEVREAVRAGGLSNLAAPRELRVVHEMPLLGTGKIDYRSLERLIQPQNLQPESASTK